MLKKNAAAATTAFNNLHAVKRLFFCFCISLILYLCIPPGKVDGLTHLLLAWDAFSICMLVASWITFITTKTEEMRRQAKLQDESRTFIFILVLVSTSASMLAVILLLVARSSIKIHEELQVVAAIATMVFSWLLVHTIFALRYAHLFYGDHPERTNEIASGLQFPDEQKPDYIDFAYFSFVLGMTFQVSDVTITSRKIRRIALMQGILSFGFNTIIVALTINLIAGISQ